jgi:hypothetical protein
VEKDTISALKALYGAWKDLKKIDKSINRAEASWSDPRFMFNMTHDEQFDIALKIRDQIELDLRNWSGKSEDDLYKWCDLNLLDRKTIQPTREKLQQLSSYLSNLGHCLATARILLRQYVLSKEATGFLGGLKALASASDTLMLQTSYGLVERLYLASEREVDQCLSHISNALRALG